jgi:hypothetical protein
MALFRRSKSKKQQAGDLLMNYLKLKAAGKAAKGTAKGAKKAAKGTAVQVSKRPSLVKRISLVAGAAVAAAVATKAVKSHTGGGDPAAA